MHDLTLITTLTGGLGAALVFGYITHRIGLSPIVGYLIAGIAVGPRSPGFAADLHLAEQLAEIGVILLMFGVGLQFHIKELIAVRSIAIPGAVGQSLAATALGAVVAHWVGWGWTAGVVLGLAISVASTVVLVRVLSDNRALHTRAGHIAVGWLVVEDIFTVVVLVLLPAMFGGGGHGPAASLPVVLALTAAKLGGLLFVLFLGGGRLIPWLLDHVAATRSRELFTLAVLAIALGIAVASATLFGVSMALGAFLAGMIVGRSDFSLRAASEALPMRDAFAVLFFVSVGMLFDPRGLLDAPLLAAGVLAIVLIGKPLAALLIVLAMRYPLKVALTVAVALGQIGEFTFILGSLATELKLLPESAMNLLVASAIVSITINPLLFRQIGPIAGWIERRGRRSAPSIPEPGTESPAEAGMTEADARAAPSPNPGSGDDEHRAIVVGYGPIGRTVTRLLRENQIEPSIVEMNLETVRRLRSEGVSAHYGDATRLETLVEAGVHRSQTLILSADLPGSCEVIRTAKDANPDIRVLARVDYLRDAAPLRAAGACAVFSGEGEVAVSLTCELLRDLGATPDQIDRERERVHEEIDAGSSPAHTQAIAPGH